MGKIEGKAETGANYFFVKAEERIGNRRQRMSFNEKRATCRTFNREIG
jgi:hypothetical protein